MNALARAWQAAAMIFIVLLSFAIFASIESGIGLVIYKVGRFVFGIFTTPPGGDPSMEKWLAIAGAAAISLLAASGLIVFSFAVSSGLTTGADHTLSKIGISEKPKAGPKRYKK